MIPLVPGTDAMWSRVAAHCVLEPMDLRNADIGNALQRRGRPTGCVECSLTHHLDERHTIGVL